MRTRVFIAVLFLSGAAAAAPKYLPPVLNTRLDLFPAHPRLVFRPPFNRGFGRTVEDVRKLFRSDAAFRSIFEKALRADTKDSHPAMPAACWLVSGDDRYARAAAERMLTGRITSSGSGDYSNVWSYALAYDWLYDFLTADQRRKIAAGIIERLETELAELDRDGMALWHGRNQAANGAIIAALAIGDLPGQQQNLQRAAAHYVESLRALEFSEGWPEGASYWIYNRAGPYAVASDCVLTALGTESIGGIPIREVMRKIGLWSIYQFTPAGFFEPYGDSSGSLQLGETGWWELTADYYARLSRDPAVMAGADFLRNRSPVPYGKRPYQWYAALSYDPSVRPKRGYDPARPELWMRKHLPQAMLFGRDSLGVAFFRGKWGDPDELYGTFKAGDFLAHHDHYDTGHFSIQRGGLLAPRTGLYGPGGYTGRHRLGYAIQTVSSNSLLILAAGETSADLRSQNEGAWTALAGGQRVIRSTGFDCVSLEHFKSLLNSGPHLERAAITAFESSPKRFDFIAADITSAYNSTRWAEPGAAAKAALVTRQFLYLRPEEAFVVYDRVETTKPDYLAKFVLHSLAKPRSETEALLAGSSPDDGILATADRRLTTTHERGVLTQLVLLPEDARSLKIGGPHYNCYVESGGDESAGFHGVNLDGGDPFAARKTAQLGLWRTEVEPAKRTTNTRFLNVLLPRLAGDTRLLPRVETLKTAPAADAVRVGETAVVFAHAPRPLEELLLEAGAARRLVLADAVRAGRYRVGRRTVSASAEGVLTAPLPKGLSRIRLITVSGLK